MEKRLVITFNTSTEAMIAEKFFKKYGNNFGELISIPNEISAGCGLSWSAPLELKDEVLNMLKREKVGYDNIYEI